MAGKITALQFQKRNKDRVNVYIDGRFAFGLAVIEAAHLRVNQALSDEDIAQLRARDEVERAYERALNFLSYRPRSEDEVGRNLRKRDIDDKVIGAVVERLVRAGLLDDREFARYWIENRVQFNPRGIRALRHELRKKGLPDAVIDEALANLDEETAARKAVKAGARRLSHLDSTDFQRKLGAYMARRGFSYAVVGPLVKEMLEARCHEMSSDNEGEEGYYE